MRRLCKKAYSAFIAKRNDTIIKGSAKDSNQEENPKQNNANEYDGTSEVGGVAENGNQRQ